MCTECFEKAHGETPEMGDDWNTFQPGTCSECGQGAIIFTITF